ncbi:MAG: hypothetical protein QM516_13530 [Limnohabitans sp.]|nr:hypothetical protein [Limnohabitans sp.]
MQTNHQRLTVGAFLKASLAPSVATTCGGALAASLVALSVSTVAAADGTWEIMATADGVSSAALPGIKGAVWVPNQWNNPTIDSNGNVSFRGQIAGPGITNTGATANHLVQVRGTAGAWTIVARNNSGVPGDTPAGAIISRTASPNNSLVSANNMTANGGVLASGYMTGTGITAGTNDTATWFVPASGTPVLLAQGRDACPGTAGALLPANMTVSSGLRVNDAGEYISTFTLSGGDTVTANNSALLLIRSGADQLIMRKGDPAPGLSGLTVTPGSFSQYLNGSNMAFTGTLVGTGVTTANDAAYFTNVGVASGVRMWAREGDAIPGFKGLTFATGSFSFSQRPLSADGTITFITTLGGSATSLNNTAVMTENNGSFTILIRKGDAIPGITDSADPNFSGKVFSTPSTSNAVRTSSGMYAFEGIFMNADGSSITSPAPATYIGVRKADGTMVTVCRQTDPVPGMSGFTFDSLSGSTSLCAAANGVIVFNANVSNAGAGTFGNALMAWDAVGGLRLLAKTGDTNFTGTAVNQLTLIGSTGNNGNGSGAGLSDNGWLVIRAGDSASGLYAIARIRVEPPANNCPADFNDDGNVGADDLAQLLSAWGTSAADLDGDGDTGASDLAILLSSWGACP